MAIADREADIDQDGQIAINREGVDDHTQRFDPPGRLCERRQLGAALHAIVVAQGLVDPRRPGVHVPEALHGPFGEPKVRAAELVQRPSR